MHSSERVSVVEARWVNGPADKAESAKPDQKSSDSNVITFSGNCLPLLTGSRFFLSPDHSHLLLAMSCALFSRSTPDASPLPALVDEAPECGSLQSRGHMAMCIGHSPAQTDAADA